jgi:hypothetical protein
MPELPLRALACAIGAKIICWDHALGVNYEFSDGDREAHALGPDDRLVLDRLRRAGKVEYLNDDVRTRYAATLNEKLPRLCRSGGEAVIRRWPMAARRTT